MLKKLAEKHTDCLYVAFRVLVGLLFFQHGAQKLFGWLGGNQVDLMSLFGLAGVIELVGGLMIAVGLLTRWAALFGLADMIGAWVKVHIAQGWIPIQNNGELAALFFAAFLVIFAYGTRKWGLDELIGGNVSDEMRDGDLDEGSRRDEGESVKSGNMEREEE